MLRSRDRAIQYRGSVQPPATSFFNELVTGIVPVRATGSGTPTFTRATTATIPDWEGVIRTVLSGESRHWGARRVRNLLAFTEDFSNAAWTKTNATITTGQTDPNGGTTAVRVVGTGAWVFTQTLTLTAATWTESIWLKSNNGASQNINLRNVAVSVPVTVTTSWQRFATTRTGAGGAFETGFQPNGADCDLLIWHPQLEDLTGSSNTNPSEYVPNGVASAPYYGVNVDGVKDFPYQNGNTVASNVVTEATGAAIPATTLLGYLPEPAATNLCLQSNAFTTTWTTGATTVTTNAVVAPDGTLTADKYTGDGTAAGHFVRQSLTVAVSTTYTVSVYLQAAENSWCYITLGGTGAGGYSTFNLTTGALGSLSAGIVSRSITAAANGFYRVTVVVTTGGAVGSNYVEFSTAATDTIGITSTTGGTYAWGAQLETGSIATSYIPTTTVAVTRNVDLDSYATSGNVPTNNVTLSMTWTPQASPSANGTVYLWGSYVDANNYTLVFHDGTNIVVRKRIAGANTDATKALAYTSGTSYIIAARFSSTLGIDVFVNGVIGTNHANTTALQLGATFQIGADGNGTVSGVQTIKNDRVFPTALSNAQVAQIPL